ncbi:MAG: type II toxin-antitoxin system Phd/YefM family antitoxin [Candidatus Eiseniibacteriota bacterium]
MQIGAYEAKTHLAALLKRVARGERITITRHGRPIALLVPPAGAGDIAVTAAVEAIRAFGRSHRLTGVSLRELIDPGRR